jgi:hypothetical protein
MGKKQNLSDFTSDITDGTLPWPRIVDDQRKWYHSDICKLAFFYVHPVFKKIKEGDSQ